MVERNGGKEERKQTKFLTEVPVSNSNDVKRIIQKYGQFKFITQTNKKWWKFSYSIKA